MPPLHDPLLPLLGLAALLGLKHGMDADHLATIDGLTRFNAAQGKTRLASWCGLLFSLGHGAVVCLVALSCSLLFRTTSMPPWLASVGSWVSIFFLLLLGLLNLHAVLTTPAQQVVSLQGLKGRWLGRLHHAGHPLAVALVGALFALSFDTMTQAALFAAGSATFGGAPYALLLALAFTLGMIITDAANSLWISRLLRRADAMACTASRIMGLGIALLCLAVAALSLSRQHLPQVSGWLAGKELEVGAMAFVVVAASFLLACFYPRNAAS